MIVNFVRKFDSHLEAKSNFSHANETYANGLYPRSVEMPSDIAENGEDCEGIEP